MSAVEKQETKIQNKTDKTGLEKNREKRNDLERDKTLNSR